MTRNDYTILFLELDSFPIRQHSRPIGHTLSARMTLLDRSRHSARLPSARQLGASRVKLPRVRAYIGQQEFVLEHVPIRATR